MAQSQLSLLLRDSADKLLAEVNNLKISAADIARNKTKITHREVMTQILDPITLHLASINTIIDQVSASDTVAGHTARPPATLLSITQLRGVYTAVELLWRWGISPVIGNMLKGDQRSTYPKSIIVIESTVIGVEKLIVAADTTPDTSAMLESIVRLLERTCTSFVFRGMMLGRNLKRIIVAAISLIEICEVTLSSAEHSAGGDMKPLYTYSSTLLQQIMDCRPPYVDTVAVVDALRHASLLGSPPIQKRTSGCLVHVLLLPNGLRSVLAVYMDGNHIYPLLSCYQLYYLSTTLIAVGVAESSQATARIVRIARLVTSCPATLPTSLPQPDAPGEATWQKQDIVVKTREETFFNNIATQLTPVIIALHKQRNDQVCTIIYWDNKHANVHVIR
jgi:hypothetical protein